MKNRRAIRRSLGKPRTLMEFPVPQPTTPYSSNVVKISFKSLRAARKGKGHPAVIALCQTFTSHQIKPKRASRGVIWNGRAFWWSEKGYYRSGKENGERRPLQHIVWEHHNARLMPARHEIFFRDRNRNNFSPENLELLAKAVMHKRLNELGEVRQLSPEERQVITGKRWTKYSRKTTGLLLKQFQSGNRKIKFLADRKQTFNHGPKL